MDSCLEYFYLKTFKVSLPVCSFDKVSQLILSPIVATTTFPSHSGTESNRTSKRRATGSTPVREHSAFFGVSPSRYE